jgi:GLPGLI family protein
MESVSPTKRTFVMNDSLSVHIKNQNLKNNTVYENVEGLFFLKNKKEKFIYNNYSFPIYQGTKYVKDSIPNFEWELLSDTMTILNQVCFAAKTRFRGRNYKVFYAPSIPLSDGPWKFGGLPGLILKANSSILRLFFKVYYAQID